MKKNLLVILFLGLLFCGCFDFDAYFEDTPKCNTKKALVSLEEQIKQQMEERYKALFLGIQDVNKANRIAQEIGGINTTEQILDAHKAYTDKDVKVELSLFRTQDEAKEEKLRYCRAEAKIIFPDTPPSLKTSGRFLKAYYWGIQKQNNTFTDEELEAIVSGNTTRKEDIWYKVEFTDDKKVYVELLPEGMEGE